MKERKILIAAILAATVFCVSVMPVVQRWWKKDAGVEARGQEEEDKGEIQLFSFPTLNLNIEKNRAKELGSAENPFIVLEIVPFEGYAEIGYLIGGCEPIDFEKAKYDNITGGLMSIVGSGGVTGIYCEEEIVYVDFYNEANRDIYPSLNATAQCYGYFEKTAPGTGDYRIKSGSLAEKNLSFSRQAGGDYIWVLKDSAPTTAYDGYGYASWTTLDYVKDGAAGTNSIHVSYDLSTTDRIYSMNVCYVVTEYHYKNRNFFLKNSLGVPEADIPGYQIEVVTVTPKTLNANPSLVNAADWFVVSCKAHVGNVLSLWEKYYNEEMFAPSQADLDAVRNGTITGGNRTFAENDISWEVAVAMLKKISPPGSFLEYAPLVIDVGVYDNAFGYGSPYVASLDGSIRKFADGKDNTFSTSGAVNNIFKLYLMTQIFDTEESGYFYKNYIETGLVTAMTVNGLTTGCYQPFLQKYGSDQKVVHLATYWNKYTFMDIEGNFWEPGESWDAFVKRLKDSNHILFFDEHGASHSAVRNGVFIYNGDTPMSQRFGSTYIDTTYDDSTAEIYHREPFSILEFADQKTLTPQEIMYYLLHRNMSTVEVAINGSDKSKIYTNVDYDVQNADTALIGEIVTKEDGLYGRVHFNIELQSKRAVESILIKIDLYQEDEYDNPNTESPENLISFTSAYNRDGELCPVKLGEDFYYDVPLRLLSKQSTEELKFSFTIWYRYKNSAMDKEDPDSYVFEKVLNEYKIQEDGSVIDNRRSLVFVRRAMFDLD